MRTESEIRKLILDFAGKDPRVRAVLLNGSRANPHVAPDRFQDFDLVFIVEEIDSFVADPDWTAFLGETIIRQLPDAMRLGNPAFATYPVKKFSYLMLFRDGNRIDLTLFSKAFFGSDFSLDSLTVVWLDKDNIFPNLPPASENDYLTKKPGEIEFEEVCNEFWWVSTYVAKGLMRGEIIYAKEMMETVLRPILMRVIEWKIGSEHGFAVAFGKSGRNLAKLDADETYARLMKTYADAKVTSNKEALFAMMELFRSSSDKVARQLGFDKRETEGKDVTNYIKAMLDRQAEMNSGQISESESEVR